MSKKALIVDNDFFFVEFLTELLEARDYDVIKAYDGKDGISKLEDGQVDLIFTDLNMLKIDGIQFIKFVRKKFSVARIPVIVITGILIEQWHEVKNIGANYYIAKGSTKAMAVHINSFMKRIESHSLPDPDDVELFEPENLFPRQDVRILIESLNFERSITESVGMGIFVVDKDAKVIKTNSLAFEILGKSFEEVLNQHIAALFSGTEKEKIIDALKKVIQNPNLAKTDVLVHIQSKMLRIIISSFKIREEIVGWVIAMEEMGQ